MEHAGEGCTCEGKFCKDCELTYCLGHMQYVKNGDKIHYIARCIPCRNKQQRLREKANPEKTRQMRKRALAKRQALDEIRPVSESLKQIKRERANEWNKAHSEKVKAYKKEWKLSNPERVKAHREAFRNRPGGKDRIHAYMRNREARKKAVLGAHTPEQIQDQLKRQKHKCYYCQKQLQKVEGKYVYHVEHTFPLSRVAGTDIPANSIDYLVLACPHCNTSKKDKFPWEWPEGGRLL
jgi:HNH endonuclease